MDYTSMQARNSSILYRRSLDNLLFKRGVEVPSRIGMTLEDSVVSNLMNPIEMVPFTYGRQANYFGMLAEALWLLSDIEELALLETWNGELAKTSDDGVTLYGAYGPRISRHPDQLATAIEVLRRDHDSRQVVLSIWRATDLGRPTKDAPCNDMVMFKIRDGMLHMTVMNRSNDIHWGLFGVNFPQFAMLQNYIAGAVGVKVGWQSHVSDSLHLYLESHPHKVITDRMTSGVDDYLDFYNYFPVGWHDPFPIWGDFDWRHNDKVRSIRALFTYINEHIRLGYLDIKWRETEFCMFIRTAIVLLSTYGYVKNKTITRLDAIVSLRRLLERAYDGTTKEETKPLDWIFGAYYTLVSQADPKYRQDYAQRALSEFLTFASKNDKRGIDVPHHELAKFLMRG